MFENWTYNENGLNNNEEYYGRVLDIDEKTNHLLILVSSDEEVLVENIYCVKFNERDLRWYVFNQDRQKYFQKDRNKATKEKGNLPLKYVCGPRVEIITCYEKPIFLKTKAI